MDRILFGTLTIGQAPRADIVPILEAELGDRVSFIHSGVLDGLSRAEIDRRFAPLAGEGVLTSRLADGGSVVMGKAAVRAVLDVRLAELEARGCKVILLLCTGEFEGLSCRQAWLVEPDHLIPPVLAALTVGRQVGVMVPLPGQMTSEARKWAGLSKPPVYAAASPYAQGLDAVAEAARALRAQGAEIVVLDCMGFTERHRECVREASGLPVILSNALMARLAADLV